jgi:hypothetical protein
MALSDPQLKGIAYLHMPVDEKSILLHKNEIFFQFWNDVKHNISRIW